MKNSAWITPILGALLVAAAHSSHAQTPRKYYITKSLSMASKAASACSKGYHMASIFEIEDTTAVRYNNILGQTSGDMGSGPPVGIAAFARTGLGGANQSCNAWTTDDPNLQGYTFMLVFPLNAGDQFGHWKATLMSCSSKVRVACIQD